MDTQSRKWQRYNMRTFSYARAAEAEKRGKRMGLSELKRRLLREQEQRRATQ
jgi:hypothetical protein